MTQRIGVLALQGAFREHCEMLRQVGAECVEVRLPEHLAGLDGLIIPGGESTTIGKLAAMYGLDEAIKRFVAGDHAVYGTCAGMIYVAKDAGREQPLLGLVNIKVRRNAFGRQIDSFETGLDFPAVGTEPFPAVFIRAPWIDEVGPEVEVLSRLSDGTPVAARQGNILVTSFHPELTGDPRIHRLFLQLCAEAGREREAHEASLQLSEK